MMKDKLVEGYGFIGTDPNTLYKFGNGKYKTFEGTEIVAENCLKAKIKDLVVEGKTIQDTEDLSNIESVAERENNILSVEVNEDITTLNLPIPLRSLPNGVADTIEGNKLVQRVGKVVLDGTEGVGFYNASTYARFSINMPINAKAYSKRTAVYAKGYYFDAIMNEDRVIFSSAVEGANRLYIYNYDYKTVNDFKAYLTENPLEVYYELSEPIIHDLEVPSISTTKGTNIITTTNNIKPKLSMKVKVK